MAKDSAPRFRLLGNEAMGGHRARQGFRFQDLWLSFQLLDWVEQDNFRGAVNEGVDDVDASWFRGDRRNSKADRSKFDWEIHQLKDTAITPKLLDEIFDAFRRKEAEFPATWSRYHLVATRCVERLNSLPALLRQTRNYLFTHGIGSPVAMAAIAEFGDKLKHLGVVVDPEFIVDRVELDFAAGWIGDKDLFAKQFNLRLAGRGIPPGRVEEAGQALVAMVSGGKVGGLVSRESVVELLDRFKPKIVAEPTLVAVELPAKQVEERRPRSETRSDEPALISVFPGGGVLLRLPGGAHGLIDCSMAAASQIIAYLNEHKVEVLEFVAISHLHVDRYSGL